MGRTRIPDRAWLSLAKYTLVDDGQSRWYADTQALIAGLVAVGYTYEEYRGRATVVEPERGSDAIDGEDEAYSELCRRVDSVDDATVAADPSTEVESLEYQPGTVGERRLRVSRDLGHAVYAATP